MPKILFITEESDRAEAALMQGVAATYADIQILGNVGSPHLLRLKDSALAPSIIPFNCRGRFDLRAMRELRAVISAAKPDLVHAFTSRTLSVATLALRGSKIPRVGYRGTAGHLSWLNPADWLTYLNPSIAAIMCVSDAVRHSLIQLGIPAHRLATIYKGHSPEWYQFSNPRASRAEFNIPESAIVIGVNANMRAVKGVDILLEAAKSLPTDGRVHYLLVGEVRDAKIHKLADHPSLKAITHLTGYREDATRLMHSCDIFALPSRDREGLPKSLIETMCGSVAIVASAVGGIPEVIRSGVDGILVPPEDPVALAAALRALITDPTQRSALAQKARERVLNNFSCTQAVNKLTALYTNILKGSSSQEQQPYAAGI